MNITLTSLTRALVVAMALPLAAAGTRMAGKAKTQAPSHPINLNSASVTELMQLPKVGQKTAERIISFRKQHGGFTRSEELMNVKGIGEKSFVKLQPYLSVGGSGGAAPSAVMVFPAVKASHPKHAAASKTATMK